MFWEFGFLTSSSQPLCFQRNKRATNLHQKTIWSSSHNASIWKCNLKLGNFYTREHIYRYTHWANPNAPIVQIMKTIRLCSLTHTVIRTCYPHWYLQLLVPRPWLHQPQKAVLVPIGFQVQFEDGANFVEPVKVAQWLVRMTVEELEGSAYAAASSVIPTDKKTLEGLHSIPKAPNHCCWYELW